MSELLGSLSAPRRTTLRKVLQRLHLDPTMLVLSLLLMLLGLLVLYSATFDARGWFWRQLSFLGIGLVLALVLAQVPLRMLRQWALVPWVGGMFLLVAVDMWGLESKGGQRWLCGPGLCLQPSEPMKLALIVLLAALCPRWEWPLRIHHLLLCLALIALPAWLVLRQPDLGTTSLLVCSGMAVLVITGLRWRYITALVVLILVSVPLFWTYVLHDYQKQRVRVFLDPERDPLGSGWNLIQAKTAIGSGGWAGKGWLAGTQSQLDFLPERHTDFIIAVLAEEFGLRGVLVLLALYLMLCLRGIWIGINATNMFGRLLAGGWSLAFFAHVFVNMGMVCGLLPIVGAPLPLVSYGGTSMLTLCMGLGLVMAVATEQSTYNRR